MTAPAPRLGGLAWLGHATVVLDLGGVRLVTDPVLTGRVLHLRRQGPAPAPAAYARADAALLSHLHFDHCHLPSLRRLGRGTPLVAPDGAGALLRRAGFADVVELRVGASTTVGGATVTAVPADHDDRRHPRGASAPPVGYLIEAAGQRVYFAGDTGLFDGMGELAGRVDVALLPVWGWGPTLGEGHMDPQDAAHAAALIRPTLVVPIHWGTLFPAGLARARGRTLSEPPHAFARLVARLAPDVHVDVLEPGGARALP